MPPTKNKANGIFAAAGLVDQASMEIPLSDETVDKVIKLFKKHGIKVSISNLTKLKFYSGFLTEERSLIEKRGHDPEFYESLLALPEEVRVILANKLSDSRLTAQNAKIMLTLLHRLFNTDSATARDIVEKIACPINPKKVSSQVMQVLERYP